MNIILKVQFYEFFLQILKILGDLDSRKLEIDMPCFDPEDVIFITNKWDTIHNEDGDLEGEISRTWEAFLVNVRRTWRSVKRENIFRMSLKDVTTYSNHIFQLNLSIMNRNYI